VLVRIQSKLESDGPWSAVDGWSSAEFDILPRVGEFISLQHIAKHGVWLRVDHIVHTPNNVRPISENDARPYKAILYVTWLSQDAIIAPKPQTDDAAIEIESSDCIRRSLDRSGPHPLPALDRLRRRWRQ
jgi:hypothetical protein